MNSLKHLGMDELASYFIRVEGSIGERWSDWFGGLAMTVLEEGTLITTTLEGTITDQAALLGLLQRLYTLGLPLLEVRYQEPRADQPCSPSGDCD